MILSDGEFPEKVLDVVERLQSGLRRRVKITTIGYGRGFVGRNLRALAARKRGRFIRLSEE